MNQPKDVSPKKIDKLRIEFIHKPKKVRKIKIRIRPLTFPVQNEAFEYGFKVTNIGKRGFMGCDIEKVATRFTTTGTIHDSNKNPHIRALNPGESIDVFFDKITTMDQGTAWISCTLIPVDANSSIETYQHDKNHGTDEAYPGGKNRWEDQYFIQGKMELLQSNTNSYILVLTGITVLEAVFGLQNILKACFGLLSNGFLYIAKLFSFFSNLMN